MAKNKKDNSIEFFLNNSLKDFVSHVSSLNKTLFTVYIMQKMYELESNKVKAFIKKKAKILKEEKKSLQFKLKANDISGYEKLKEEANRSMIAIKVLPRSLMVSMVSQFDCLITVLIEKILKKYEGTLSTEKTLNVSELKNLKNKGDIIDFLIEKEIHSLGYDNHISHIEWIESKTGAEIIKHIKEDLPVFIEITERRNLFVHSDGKIDSKYLSNCKKGKVIFDKNYKKGDELYVTPKYFNDSFDCLYTISSKIIYILWKKLSSKDNSDELNEFFNNEICIKLIQEKDNKLSGNILRFILDNFKNSTTEAFVKVFTINYALSKKLSGDNKEALKIISNEDWSASNDDLKLAVSIIKGDYNESFDLMERIGKSGYFITKESYKTDPIFIPIRKMDKFINLYKKIFNEDYLSLEQEIDTDKNLIKNKTSINK